MQCVYSKDLRDFNRVLIGVLNMPDFHIVVFHSGICNFIFFECIPKRLPFDSSQNNLCAIIICTMDMPHRLKKLNQC